MQVNSAIPANSEPLDFSRVLVVEDDKTSFAIIRRLLTKSNCHVELAETGTKALANPNLNDFELIFMDCLMPGIDGFETTAQIRDRGINHVPIIAVTGSDTPETRIKCIRAGMNDVLIKPVNASILRQCLERWLGSTIPKEREPYEQMHQYLNQLGYPAEVLGSALKYLLDTSESWSEDLHKHIQDENLTETLNLSYRIRCNLSLLGAEYVYSGIRLLEEHVKRGDWTSAQKNEISINRLISETSKHLQALLDNFDELTRSIIPEHRFGPEINNGAFDDNHLAFVDADPLCQLIFKNMRTIGWNFEVFTAVDDFREWVESGIHPSMDCILCSESIATDSPLDAYRIIREIEPCTSVILLSHFPSKNLVNESLREGVFQLLSRPTPKELLLSTIKSGIQRTIQRRDDFKRQQVAKKIGVAQQKLLSKGIGIDEGLVNRLFCLPKHEAGGDFWVKLHPETHKHIFILSDVSGHDMESAFVSAYFQGFLRGALKKSSKQVNDVLVEFNRFLCQEWNKTDSGQGVDKSLVCCSAEVDLQKQELTFYLNGSCIPLIIRDDGTVFEVANHTEIPLGWFDEISQHAHVVSLENVSGFCAWSDGIEELAMDLGINLLSVLFRLLNEDEPIEPTSSDWYTIAKDDLLAAFVGLNKIQSSDRPRPIFYKKIEGDKASSIDEIQSELQDSINFAMQNVIDDELMYDILLCTREGVLNALKHGCQGLPEKFAEITLLTNNTLSTLTVQIRDGGDPLRADLLSASQFDLGQHRGLALLKSFSHDLEFCNRTKTLWIHFNLPTNKEILSIIQT